MTAVQEWAAKNRKRYEDNNHFVCAGAKKFKITVRAFRAAIADPTRKRGGPGSGPQPLAVRSRKSSGITLDELLAAHDTDTKIKLAIRKALGELVEGKAVTDAEFRSTHCRVGSQGWKIVSAEPEFKKNRFRITGAGGGIYWATTSTVKEALVAMPFKAKEM